jgi:polar amino acid transport system ATP-binding protein
MTAPMVLAERVHKHYGRHEVLKGIDLTVRPGEVMCIIGRSGSGKSTFLRCINHLEKIDAGRLSVDGELVGYRQEGDRLYELREREMAGRRAQIGMVFQHFNLFGHMTAVGNVCEAPMRVAGVKRGAAEARARELLDRVGLADRADHYPAQLSGGQQQRVAIARALATRPEVIFCDEPTGALDSRTAADVLGLLRAVVDDHGQTVVMVTHDPIAASYADRVLILADGRIVGDLPQPGAARIAEHLASLDRRASL